jgi:hypothetical protein
MTEMEIKRYSFVTIIFKKKLSTTLFYILSHRLSPVSSITINWDTAQIIIYSETFRDFIYKSFRECVLKPCMVIEAITEEEEVIPPTIVTNREVIIKVEEETHREIKTTRVIVY